MNKINEIVNLANNASRELSTNNPKQALTNGVSANPDGVSLANLNNVFVNGEMFSLVPIIGGAAKFSREKNYYAYKKGAEGDEFGSVMKGVGTHAAFDHGGFLSILSNILEVVETLTEKGYGFGIKEISKTNLAPIFAVQQASRTQQASLSLQNMIRTPSSPMARIFEESQKKKKKKITAFERGI